MLRYALSELRYWLRAFCEGLRQNSVALISLIVAVAALTVNSQRADLSELQRSQRNAGFSLLKELHTLQLLVDQAHYGQPVGDVDAISGWVGVNYIRDLAAFLPPPVPERVDELHAVWTVNVESLGLAEDLQRSLQANQAITEQLSDVRTAVKQSIQTLR